VPEIVDGCSGQALLDAVAGSFFSMAGTAIT
jgi:hypothetical protein